MAADPPADHEVPPERAAELLASGEAQLVDVRTESEHAAGHIAGATHVPFDELPARAGELDRSRSLVFYCQGGSRSEAAAQAFAASGWDARTMTGGLDAWAERGLPLEPDGGTVVPMSGLPESPASTTSAAG
jgi:rhodanese-related sulfurtransferase